MESYVAGLPANLRGKFNYIWAWANRGLFGTFPNLLGAAHIPLTVMPFDRLEEIGATLEVPGGSGAHRLHTQLGSEAPSDPGCWVK